MEYSYLEHYLNTGKYHPSTPDYKKRGIRKASRNFLVKDKTLIYIGKGRMQVVCRNESDKHEAIQWCHNNRPNLDDPCNVKDTIRMLQQSYYWHGLKRDIEKRLYPCTLCLSQQSSPMDEVQDLSVSKVHNSEHNLQILETRHLPEVTEALIQSSSNVPKTIVETDTSKPQLSSKKEKVVNSNPFFHEETEDIETHQNGFHSNPFAGYENSRSAITAASERMMELLLERINQLENINSSLVNENEALKERIEILHRTIENQKSVPLLRDLIFQLKESTPVRRAMSDAS